MRFLFKNVIMDIMVKHANFLVRLVHMAGGVVVSAIAATQNATTFMVARDLLKKQTQVWRMIHKWLNTKFYIYLFFPVSFLDVSFIVENFSNLQKYTTTIVNTSKSYTLSSEENVLLATEEPKTTIEFNLTYLIFGACALISMLLIVIVVQLCLKSKSSKRKTSSKQECRDSSERSSISDKKVQFKMKESRNQDKFCRPLMLEISDNTAYYSSIVEHIGAAGSSYAELSKLDENTVSSSQIEKMSTEPSCSSEGLLPLSSNLGHEVGRSGNTEEKHLYLRMN